MIMRIVIGVVAALLIGQIEAVSSAAPVDLSIWPRDGAPMLFPSPEAP